MDDLGEFGCETVGEHSICFVEDKDVDPIDPRNNVDLTFLDDTLDCRPIRA